MIPLLLLGGNCMAQNQFSSTIQIIIQGNIIKNDTIYADELAKMKDNKLKDIAIRNHLGEYKFTMHGIRGIALTEILKNIELDHSSPKDWSRYSFWIEANDGYKVCFSWNELFNNTVGEQVYLLTQENYKPINNNENSIALISLSDKMSGRRYVKRLEKITVLYQ